MPGHGLGFVAEQYAFPSVSVDLVVKKVIVGILVADGDPGLAVVIEAVVFEDPVFDPPAEEQADAAVPDRPAVADGG